MVSVIRENVVSDHGEATVKMGNLLEISFCRLSVFINNLYVPIVTKYYYHYTGSVQLYAHH